MFRFKSLTLSGVVTHEETKIDFTPGLHIIRGANASGKSTIFNALTQLVTGEVPHSGKKGYKPYQGQVRLDFDLHDFDYSVSLDMGKGKYSISKDGRFTEFRKPKDSANAVGDIFPWTLQAWQNFVYVSSASYPVLLYGSNAARRKVFENIFSIDTNSQHKAVRDRLNKIKQYETIIDTLRKNLPELSMAQLKANVERIDKDIEKARKEIRAAVEDIKASSIHARWDALCNDYPVLKVDTKQQLKKIADDLASRKYDDYLYNLQDYHLLKEIKAEIAELKEKLSGIDFDEKLLDEDYLNYVAANSNRISEAIKATAPASFDESRIEIIDQSLDILEKQKTACCPMCGTSIKAEKLIEKLHVERKALTLLEKEHRAYKAKTAVLNNLKSTFYICPSNEKDLKKHLLQAKKAADIRKNKEHRNRLEYLNKQFSSLEKVKDFKPDKALTKYYRALDEVSLKIGSLIDEKLTAWNTKQEDSVLEKELSAQQDQLEILIRQRESYMNDMKAWRKWNKEYPALRLKSSYKKVLEKANHIYGPKGLRSAAVEYLANQWVEEFNVYAQRAYGKDYRFFVVNNASGIAIMCERNNNGKSLVSDVRMLSGYESKMFPLCSIMAMNSIMSESVRSNILVLDEIEANMDAKSRSRLVSLLPMLQDRFESLWMITPSKPTEFFIQDSDLQIYEHRIIKENGISRLEDLK